MASTLHSKVAAGSRHALQNLEYPDTANREAGTSEANSIAIATENIDQIAKQVDNDTLFHLMDVGPPVWSQLWTTVNATVDTNHSGFMFATNDGLGAMEIYGATNCANVVIGHPDNSVTNYGNTVSGGGQSGAENRITGAATRFACIGGGSDNHIDGASSVGALDATASVLSGGQANVVASSYSFLGGGSLNRIGTDAPYSVVAGGVANRTDGIFAAILGGENNYASGIASVCLGSNVTASGDGSFGIGDHSGVSVNVATDNRLEAYMTNGYRFEGGITTIWAASNNRDICRFDVLASQACAIGADASNGGYLQLYHPSGAVSLSMDATNYRIGIGTSAPTDFLDINGNSLRIRTAKTPGSASDTGNPGQISWDNSYIYVCVAANTWKRVGITTW